MKKFGLILLSILVIVCGGCKKKLTTYTEISYDNYVEKLEKKETFPLVIGAETCSACGIFQSTMEIFIEKYQVEVFFIDVSKISEIDYNLLQSQTSFDGTPTTIFIEEGEMTSYYNRIDGAKDLTSVTKFFKDNNYID